MKNLLAPTNKLVSKMFDVQDISPEIRCPYCYPDSPGVPHILNVHWGREVPPTSTSGPGMVITWECENEHRWQLVLEDHSGGTWLSVRRCDPAH